MNVFEAVSVGCVCERDREVAWVYSKTLLAFGKFEYE